MKKPNPTPNRRRPPRRAGAKKSSPPAAPAEAPAPPSPAAPDPAAPPEDLVGDARAFWLEFGPYLVARGTLQWHTRPSFRLLCECWQFWRSLAPWDDPLRAFVITDTNYTQAHPAQQARAQAARQLRELFAQFGLQPVAHEPPGDLEGFADGRPM